MIVEMYDVYEPLDKTEGRGETKLLGRFCNRSVAASAALGRGVMGGDATVRVVNCVVVNGLAYEIRFAGMPISKSVRESILNRMDPEEREIIERGN